jgi:hypothetical protein
MVEPVAAVAIARAAAVVTIAEPKSPSHLSSATPALDCPIDVGSCPRLLDLLERCRLFGREGGFRRRSLGLIHGDAVA